LRRDANARFAAMVYGESDWLIGVQPRPIADTSDP